MQQENAKRMGVDMCEGNKNMVETSFMEWLLNPSEVIIVRPILQWVDFEHSTRYFGRIAGVCETHGCLSLVMGPLQRELSLVHQLGVDLILGSSASLG